MKDSLCVNLLTQARKLGLQIRRRIFFFTPPPFHFQVERGGDMYLYENTNSVELARRVFHAIFLPPFFFSFFCCSSFSPLLSFLFPFHHWQILIGLFLSISFLFSPFFMAEKNVLFILYGRMVGSKDS